MSTQRTADAHEEPAGAGVDLGPLADQVGYHLRLANTAAIRSFNEALGPFDLSPADYGALVIIEANPGLIQQDLAAALGLQRANLVRVLNALEARGMVMRSGESRRENALYLTEDGKNGLPAIRTAHAAHEQRMAEALNGDLAATIQNLRRITAVRT
jgi:DNA-binding MarR family transcriptional regulator